MNDPMSTTEEVVAVPMQGRRAQMMLKRRQRFADASGTKKQRTEVKHSLPWVELYRPETFDDVCGNEHIVSRLKLLAESKNLPHMILAGPPGTGKTTSVLCLARAIMGEDFRSHVLFINASDDRQISVVRTKVRDFIGMAHSSPCAYRIIFLDEVDSMTHGAQESLRSIVEKATETTRFMLACNDSSKVIESLQSRCVVQRFTRLSHDQIASRLMHIIRAEKIQYAEDGLQALLDESKGDLRSAINNLQSICAYTDRQLTHESVYRLFDRPQPEQINRILCWTLTASVDAPKALGAISSLLAAGYSAEDLIEGFIIAVKTSTISEPLKVAWFKVVGHYHGVIKSGLANATQLYGMIADMHAAKEQLDNKIYSLSHNQ